MLGVFMTFLVIAVGFWVLMGTFAAHAAIEELETTGELQAILDDEVEGMSRGLFVAITYITCIILGPFCYRLEEVEEE